MERLLPALEGLPPVYLVGGAVRDLLLGFSSVDLDLAVEGDARWIARELAERLGGHPREHERFGTATVRAEGLSLDLASTRRERYERPGALPVVEPAPLAEDLRRRDFTINAMAAGLSGEDFGRLHDPHGGRADLEARRVRVLHERSFVDDPTRLLRAVRYEVRFGFALEPWTEQLARAAATGDAFATVSGPRVRDELLDLLGEVKAPTAVRRLRELGLDRALHPALSADQELVASALLACAETGARPELAALAALVYPRADELEEWLEELSLGRGATEAVLGAAREAPQLAGLLRGDLEPSAIRALLDGEPPEVLAFTLALGAPGEPILRYLRELRVVRLEITGDDLIAAGAREGPALGRALEETLRRKLDGQLSGRDAELRYALAVAREAS